VTILCLGEAIVDLVCERRTAAIEAADSFRPYSGGVMANIAVAARRGGAPAALAGGVGDDHWGRWLRSRLAHEAVDLRWFSLVDGLRTPVTFVTFDLDGEAAFQLYGDGIEACVSSVRDRLPDAVAEASALVMGSNTLVGEPERGLTLQARRLATERGIPVLFDPNLRLHRWPSAEVAIERCRQVCEGSFCVRANRAEAAALTGSEHPEEAAGRLLSLGARIAVVTLGPDGALLRGAAQADAEGAEVEVVSPLGAGDAFMGTFVARLAAAGWELDGAPPALAAAVDAAARACTHWGAIE
jgi:sugar/nucleoside kinase (ribokinase family)